MNQHVKHPSPTLAPTHAPTPAPTFPPSPDESKRQIKPTEPDEVLGMHKNSGQKDHKGAR